MPLIMTDQQLDAFLDRQVEQYETWLEELNEEHLRQQLDDIVEEVLQLRSDDD